jgi:hypothetical protein
MIRNFDQTNTQDPKVLQAFREFNVELFTVESVLFYLDAKHYATVRP